MKKTLIAAAVMAASGIAFAASNVTLYGVIETGVVVQKAKHHDTNVAMVSGFDSGSRWGIRGVEDLGNGYNVGFVLEEGYDSDTGANTASNSAGKVFGRESQLFVQGGFGKLYVQCTFHTVLYKKYSLAQPSDRKFGERTGQGGS